MVNYGTFNTYAKCCCSKLGHAVVTNIWNINVWPRQKYLNPTVSCYFMSLSDKVSYLLDSIVLLSQIIATMISNVKSKRNNISFTIEDILKDEFNWNMYEITLLCCVINIYVYRTDYIINKMIYWRKSFLNTFMQIFIMLRHLVAEISRFKFDDYRAICTGVSDLKLFWVVYNDKMSIHTRTKVTRRKHIIQPTGFGAYSSTCFLWD